MEIIPAIDILDEKVVRLRQGDYQKATYFNISPEEALRKWANAGARRIHLVDLRAAEMGHRLGTTDSILIDILNAKDKLGVKVEIGGGIRNFEEVEKLFSSTYGFDYVILGTAAILSLVNSGVRGQGSGVRFEWIRKVYKEANKDFIPEIEIPEPDLLEKSIKKFGEKVIFALDSKDGKVAVSGWEVILPVSVKSLLKKAESLGVKEVIYTDVLKDGTLSGPNLSKIEKVARGSGLNFIVSGGISSLEDVRNIKGLNLPNIKGVIIGRALYDERIDLEKAIKDERR